MCLVLYKWLKVIIRSHPFLLPLKLNGDKKLIWYLILIDQHQINTKNRHVKQLNHPALHINQRSLTIFVRGTNLFWTDTLGAGQSGCGPDWTVQRAWFGLRAASWCQEPGSHHRTRPLLHSPRVVFTSTILTTSILHMPPPDPPPLHGLTAQLSGYFASVQLLTAPCLPCCNPVINSSRLIKSRTCSPQHINLLLKPLHRLSICYRYEFKILLLTFRSILHLALHIYPTSFKCTHTFTLTPLTPPQPLSSSHHLPVCLSDLSPAPVLSPLNNVSVP